jgi:hypothetical protein
MLYIKTNSFIIKCDNNNNNNNNSEYKNKMKID